MPSSQLIPGEDLRPTLTHVLLPTPLKLVIVILPLRLSAIVAVAILPNAVAEASRSCRNIACSIRKHRKRLALGVDGYNIERGR